MPSGTFRGRATDGKNAASHPVTLALSNAGLNVRADASGGTATWPYDQLTSNVPIGRKTADLVIAVRSLPGVTVYVDDPAFARELAKRVPALNTWTYRWGGLKPGLAVSTIAAGIFAAINVFDLSPTKGVAALLPQGARAQLGERVLVTLPVNRRCQETTAGRAALDAMAQRLLPKDKEPGRRIVVLDWGLVNAFALPGGTVVLTRGVIEKAASADELAGVLAHEIGHGLELHPEAGLVRAIGIGALVQWLFTGSPGTLGNAGSFLAQIAYNRGFEREADAIALRLLRDAKISPTGFAGFFRRVDGQRPGAKGGSSPARDLFDTHPSTPERIRTIEAAAGYAATPALAPEQWFALQAICRPASSAPGGSATTPNAPAGDPMAAANARITQAPQMAASWYERGELHMTAGRFTEAESDFARAATLEPNNAHFHYRRGTALQDLRRYPDAIDAYTKAVQLNARHAQALAGRGAVHRILRNNAESERDLTAALGVNPRQQYALYQRGLLYGERKEWAAAERDFTTVIEGNRGYAYAYVRRAEAHEGQNNRTAAIADYRAALAAAPSSPNADEAFRIARQRLTALGQAQ